MTTFTVFVMFPAVQFLTVPHEKIKTLSILSQIDEKEISVRDFLMFQIMDESVFSLT